MTTGTTFTKTFFAIVLTLRILPIFGQNCEVDFPGTAIRKFSTSCGGSSVGNLDLGKNINMGDGDVFTFDIPTINISGKIHLDVDGSGKIIIPAGVTVNSDDFDLHAKNSGCTSANPCTFEIVVNGTLNISEKLKNDIAILIWSGSGKVIVDDFENSKDGCMDCGPAGCPIFEVNSFKCKDDGGCPGGDFCAAIAACASDAIKPVITGCPSDQIVNMTGPGCTQTVNWEPPIASDNCTLSSFTPSHPPGSPFPKGNTKVTYTARDAAGNIETCSFNINVVDKIPPVITGCSDITVNANGFCQAIVNWPTPSFSDNCTGGSITRTTSKPSGSTFAKGTTVVTYKATDAAGNIATCSFNVNVVDNVPPIITGCSDITVNANASCQAVVNWNAPSFTENCANGSITLITSKPPGSTFDKGTTVVTYKATDAAGNIATCSFNVTVIDAAPQLTDCPTNITVTAGPSCQAIVNWIAPTVMDCVDVTLTSNKTPGTIFEKGTTVVTYTATDVNGKTANCSFEVSVIDAAPLFTSCPSEITKDATDAGMAFVEWAVPTAEASCDNFQMTSTHRPGDVFRIGQTLVEYTATTDNGVFSTCSFMVTITLPQIIANEVLTPDGDNNNDVWLIENIEKFPDNHVIVFDRWGSVVFRVNAYNNSSIAWNGLNLPTGTYYYTLSVNVLGSKIEKKGFIELIK